MIGVVSFIYIKIPIVIFFVVLSSHIQNKLGLALYYSSVMFLFRVVPFPNVNYWVATFITETIIAFLLFKLLDRISTLGLGGYLLSLFIAFIGGIILLVSPAITFSLVSQPSKEKISTINSYLSEIDMIMDNYAQIAMQYKKELPKTFDLEAEKTIIINLNRDLKAMLREFESLSPPQELINYHEKQLETIKYFIMAYDATIEATKAFDIAGKGDKELYAKLKNDAFSYKRMAEQSSIDALKELKRVYIKYKAPMKEIQEIDAKISAAIEDFK